MTAVLIPGHIYECWLCDVSEDGDHICNHLAEQGPHALTDLTGAAS